MKSLQRHPALIPLSHDHHHGLVAAHRLKRGESAYKDIPDAAASIVELWDRELREHFQQEEAFLFPRIAGDLAVMVERAEREHGAMRDMVARCCVGPVGDEEIRTFGALLESHIRFEEREMFPVVQRILGEQELAEIEGEIAARRRSPVSEDRDEQ